MTFVTPWLMLGTVAVAIPIAIHLLLRRQPQKIIFPATRFIHQVEQSAKRSLRIRHLALLLCRIGLIVLLALLLARPSITRSMNASSSSPAAAAFVFDTSMRMNCQHNNQTLFDFALKAGQWVLSRMPSGSQVAIIDSQTKTPAFAVDRSAAKYQMEQLKPGPGAMELTGQIIKATTLLESSQLNVREIYVFTDMSSAAWDVNSAPGVIASLKKANSPAVYVIDVGTPNPINDSISPLKLEKEILTPGDKMSISTVVKRNGAKEQDGTSTVFSSRILELYIIDPSGKAVKRDEKILTNEPEQKISFTLSGFEPGNYVGYVQFSGADALKEDDCRWFAFQSETAKKALLVASCELRDKCAVSSVQSAVDAKRSSEQKTGKPLVNAFEASTTAHCTLHTAHSFRNLQLNFVSQCLSPKAYKAAGKNRYDCDVITLQELESDTFSKDKLSEYKLVFLLNPTSIQKETWEKLQQWTSDGGGLCISLGNNVEDIKSFNSSEAQTVLAGKLQLQARTGEAGAFLLPRSYVHPILQPFEKMTSQVSWQDAQAFRYWQMSDFSEDVNVVLRYSDLRPFMLERSVGKGRAITLTSPWGDTQSDWNTFASAQSWLIFALINQTADYLASSDLNRLNYRAGETASINSPTENSDWKITETISTDVSHATGEAQTVRAQNNVVNIPGLMTAGFLTAQTLSDDSPTGKTYLSYNFAEKATDLTRIDENGMNSFFGDYPWSKSRDRKQMEQRVSSARAGYELFPIIAVLLCLLLGVETWLSQRFYR